KKDLVHRTLGSIAYAALARSILLVTGDESHPDHRLLIPLKHNLGKKAAAYAFNIIEAPQSSALSPQSFEDDDPSPTLQWQDAPITNHPLLTRTIAAPIIDPLQQSRRELAMKFLKTSLAKGPLLSEKVHKTARSVGIA